MAALAVLTLVGCASKPTVEDRSPAQAAPPAAVEWKGPKLKVAVADFEDKTAFGRGRLGAGASDLFTTRLVQSGAFLVVERAKLKTVLDEQALGQSGALSDEEAAQAGRLLGVSLLLIGGVADFGVKTESSSYVVAATRKQTARAVVTIRAVDSTTAEVAFAATGEGQAVTASEKAMGFGQDAGFDETIAGRALSDAVDRLMQDLVERLKTFGWSAKVAGVDKGLVIINAGAKSGLVIGTALAVHHAPRHINDPETGDPIYIPGEKKGKIEVVSFVGEDASACKALEGEDFKPADVVRLSDP